MRQVSINIDHSYFLIIRSIGKKYSKLDLFIRDWHYITETVMGYIDNE
jgi:hypothetical protein